MYDSNQLVFEGFFIGYHHTPPFNPLSARILMKMDYFGARSGFSHPYKHHFTYDRRTLDIIYPYCLIRR